MGWFRWLRRGQRNVATTPRAGWRIFGLGRGIDMRRGAQIGEYLRLAGLQNVQERTISFPTGVSGGRVGRMEMANVLSLAAAFRGGILGQQMMAAEAYDTIVERAQRELTDPHGRCAWLGYVAYGQQS